MPIPYVRYLRPDAQRRNRQMRLSVPAEDKARDIIKAGFQIEVEDLTSGRVAVSIHDPCLDADESQEVSAGPNPELPELVEITERLVMDFKIPFPMAPS